MLSCSVPNETCVDLYLSAGKITSLMGLKKRSQAPSRTMNVTRAFSVGSKATVLPVQTQQKTNSGCALCYGVAGLLGAKNWQFVTFWIALTFRTGGIGAHIINAQNVFSNATNSAKVQDSGFEIRTASCVWLINFSTGSVADALGTDQVCMRPLHLCSI